MSQLLAYLGPHCPIGALIDGGSPSFRGVSSACVHGFGVAWYPDDGQLGAARLIDRMPLEAAVHHRMMLERVQTGCATVVAATDIEDAATTLEGLQPFAAGPFTFAHLGTISPYHEVFAPELLDGLGATARRWLPSRSPSSLLAAMWLEAIGDGRGPDAMAGALDQVVSRVRQVAAPQAALASFALVVSDGHCLVAVRTSTHGEPPTLFTSVAAPGAPIPTSGRVIASEPAFGGEWTELELNALTIYTVE